jgi:hypothetical protein
MLRGVLVNAAKKFTMVRKIHRENDRTSVDPSLSGNEALGKISFTGVAFFCLFLKYIP